MTGVEVVTASAGHRDAVLDISGPLARPGPAPGLPPGAGLRARRRCGLPAAHHAAGLPGGQPLPAGHQAINGSCSRLERQDERPGAGIAGGPKLSVPPDSMAWRPVSRIDDVGGES